MGSNPKIYDGLKSSIAIDTHSQIPGGNQTLSKGSFNAPTSMGLQYKAMKGNSCMDGIVIRTNLGFERQNLPCKPNYNSIIVGRRPKTAGLEGVYPQAIPAKSQPNSLYYDPLHYTGSKLAPIADSFNAGLNSRIPQPRFKIY